MRISDWSSDVCSSDLYVGQERRDEAEQERDRHTEADQRKHVEVAGPERLPCALEERPAAPQNHWCGERQLRPLRPCRFDPPVETDPDRKRVVWGRGV